MDHQGVEMAQPLPGLDEKKTPVVDNSIIGDGQLPPTTNTPNTPGPLGAIKAWLLPRHDQTAWAKFLRFFTFLGPGAIISVAYIDPDNYQVAISAGGSFQYKLLFMVLLSNIIAVYLQVRYATTVNDSSPTMLPLTPACSPCP
jgi:metal iron transporter